MNGTYPANLNSGTYLTGSASKAHMLVNASLSLRTEDGNWLLAVECENCLNTTYTQSTLSKYTYTNAPGTWQVRARRKF